MADYLNIAGRVRTTASDGVAMEAQEVKDLNQNKSQQEINADVQTELGDRYTKEETYNREEIAELVDPTNYVSVVATNATTAVTDILPATGEADTIYRVGNWNGTQYDPTMYALYAWNGSAYVCLAVRSFVGEVYDISVNHPDGQGNPTPYADLTAALGTNGANIPADIRRGGMSIKFIQGTVQSSDNKYVQARLMAQNFTTDVTQWQGVDDEPTPSSKNLIESGGVEKYIPITHKSFSNIDSTGNYICFVRDIPAGTTLKLKVTGTAEWNRLWISSNDNSGARLQDGVVKGTSYTITTASDITNIGLNVYTLTSSGSLRLDMEIAKTKSENDIIGLIAEETTRAQSAETNIANNVVALQADVNLIGNKISIDQTGWNKNKCIKSNGELNTSDPGYAYIKIPVLKADLIKVSFDLGLSASRAVIALTDKNESYYNVVLVGNSGSNYNYTSTENGYICVCVRFGADETILSTAVEQIRIANSNAIEDNTNVIKDISEPSKNLFDINIPTGEEGKYKGYISGSGAQHTYISNNRYNLSPYIEVEEGATYVGQINGSQYQFRFVYFYTNKGVANIIDSQTISSPVWSVTVNSGYNIKYARFCIALDSASDKWNPTIMIQKGTEITPFEHYVSFIKNDALHKPYIEGIARIEAASVRNFGLAGSLRDSATALAVSTNFTLSSLWVHKFLVTSARIKGVISNVLVGVGYNVRYGGWIELTQTQAIVHFYYDNDMTVQTETHGLTLGEDTMVSVFSNEADANKVHVVILSNGNQYEFDVTYGWALGGTPFVRNSNSLGTLDVELSATPQKITKQIWLFGDSYTYPYADRTWTKWLYQWNGNKDPWLASQQPGATSSILYTTLESLISTGARPKYIVWALGMNDGSDTNEDTPNTNWLTYVNNLVALCEQNTITPIFVTIPNVPTINHEGKNNWIKNSGYRYIDIAMAVGATIYVSGQSTWYGAGTDYDYLESATPRIHATAFGGRAMASQVLQDFPEIICEN